MYTGIQDKVKFAKLVFLSNKYGLIYIMLYNIYYNIIYINIWKENSGKAVKFVIRKRF